MKTLQFGVANAQTDKQLGLHSVGGPWALYPAKEQNDRLKKIANVDYWLTPIHLKPKCQFLPK